MIPIVSRSKSKWYGAKKFLKYALNSQLQGLQILTNDDEVENLSLSSFILAVSLKTQDMWKTHLGISKSMYIQQTSS